MFYLVEVVQSLVQIGLHSCWGLIGNFDSRLQDTLWDYVGLRSSARLSTDKQAIGFMTVQAILLHFLLQCRQPLSNKMDILKRRKINNNQ